MSKIPLNRKPGQVADGSCSVCGQKFVFGDNVYSEAGARETFISSTCESCFDEMFEEIENEEY